MKYLRDLKKIPNPENNALLELRESCRQIDALTRSNRALFSGLGILGLFVLLLLAACEHPEKKQEIEPEEECLEEEVAYEDEIYPQEVVRSELSECPIY